MYFYFSHTCYTPYPSPWLDNPNHIWWRPNIVRLHTRGFLLRLSVSVKVVYFEYICIYICLFIYLFIYLYVILALTLVAPSYSTRTTPSPTVSLFCPSHGSSRFLRNVGTYLPSCTVSHLRRLAVFHLSWLSDRRDRRWWWGGVLGGQRGELSDLIFWVVTPRSAVDIAEQSAASKWSSGREEKKGRKRGRFTRGGVSSLSAHSAVWLRWQSLGCDTVQRNSLPQS